MNGYIDTNELGFGVPEVGAQATFGFGFHADAPSDYTGFDAVFIGVFPVAGQFFWSESGVHGGQIGLYFGRPSGSWAKECYQYLSASRASVKCQ
jgi:hypothetical protein